MAGNTSLFKPGARRLRRLTCLLRRILRCWARYHGQAPGKESAEDGRRCNRRRTSRKAHEYEQAEFQNVDGGAGVRRPDIVNELRRCVEFLVQLRIAEGTIGQVVIGGTPAYCSPRRWQKFGVLYVTFMNSKLVNLYAGGMGPDELVPIFWASSSKTDFR
jgi:hypothetical protein